MKRQCAYYFMHKYWNLKRMTYQKYMHVHRTDGINHCAQALCTCVHKRISYTCVQMRWIWRKPLSFMKCATFKCIWTNIVMEKEGLIHFALITETWSSNGWSTGTWINHWGGYWSRWTCLGSWIKCQYGCSTDGHVDAHRHCYYSLWMLSRWTCWCTVTLLIVVIVCYGCLNRWTCCT